MSFSIYHIIAELEPFFITGKHPKTPFSRFLPGLFYLLDQVFHTLSAEGLRLLRIGMTRIASYLKVIQYPTPLRNSFLTMLGSFAVLTI
jgi:hypothetical protein